MNFSSRRKLLTIAMAILWTQFGVESQFSSVMGQSIAITGIDYAYLDGIQDKKTVKISGAYAGGDNVKIQILNNANNGVVFDWTWAVTNGTTFTQVFSLPNRWREIFGI